MKRTNYIAITIFFTIFLLSCKREETTPVEISSLVVDSVNIPQDTMSVAATQSITAYFQHLSGCEGLYDFSYEREGLVRNIHLYKFKTDKTCGATTTKSTNITFSPIVLGTYTLNFWQGDNIWLTKKIVVQ